MTSSSTNTTRNPKRRTTVRTGGASGFWGDTALAVPQLLAGGELDYLVFDYLAEVTMSILAAQRAKDASAGYAVDFVQIMMREALPQLQAQRIRVVASAGGVNPLACRDALLKLASELGVTLRVGVVLGDDLVGRANEFRNAGIAEMFSGEPFPQRVASINAYLGALPIARALDTGCDVVITGRCVDSAVTLGVLMHEFGWANDAYDQLAQGTLAGHLIECGAQCTGGLFTDWEAVHDWENIGSPIVEADADGSFTITKPGGTGGLVTPATVAEQLLYEIRDPRAYLVPDVSCDFTQVRMAQDGEHRVRVTGAIGRAPTASCKVSAAFADGYRNTGFLTIAGEHAVRKAQRTGAVLLTRMQRMLAARGLPPFTKTRVEVLGGEEMFGASGRSDAREVVPKMSAKAASSPTPVVRLFSFLLPKAGLSVSVDVNGERWVAIPSAGGFDPQTLGPALQHTSAPLRRQGQHREHRRDRAPGRRPGRAVGLAHARARRRALRAPRAETGRTLRPARPERDQLRASRRARRRWHGLAAHRQPCESVCASAAGDGGAGARLSRFRTRSGRAACASRTNV